MEFSRFSEARWDKPDLNFLTCLLSPVHSSPRDALGQSWFSVNAGRAGVKPLRERRNFIGIELDSRYLAGASARIREEATGTADIAVHAAPVARAAA